MCVFVSRHHRSLLWPPQRSAPHTHTHNDCKHHPDKYTRLHTHTHTHFILYTHLYCTRYTYIFEHIFIMIEHTPNLLRVCDDASLLRAPKDDASSCRRRHPTKYTNVAIFSRTELPPRFSLWVIDNYCTVCLCRPRDAGESRRRC